MKLKGSLSQAGSSVVLADGAVTQCTVTRSNAASATITLPNATGTLATLALAETLTNKTLTSPIITGAALTAVAGLALRDTSAAYDVTVTATSSGVLTAARTLTLNMVDGARTLNLGGNLTLAANLITAGANSLTLTTTGSTNVTLPTTGTLATLAGSEVLTNKTLSGNIAVTLVSGAATVTLPTTTSTLATLALAEALTNKTMGSTNTLTGATAASFTSGGNTVTLPTSVSTLATLALAETLSNKTLTGVAGITLVASGAIDWAAGTVAIGASVGANTISIGGSSSTVRVVGNLQVDGTTTTVNSTTLDVADKNITVSKSGNDAASEGAGLTVDRTSTKGSLIYKDASATKFAIGPLASEVDIVGISSSQTLTNKTLGSTNTLTGATAASFTNSGTITLPTATCTLVGKDTTDVLTNKTLTGNVAVTLVSGAATVTLPTTTSTLATLALSENLTNKTMGSTNTLTGATASSFTNTGTVTLPTATCTLVGKDTTDALTNKDFQGGTASDTSRLTVPKAALTTLSALTRKQGTLVYDTTANALLADDGSNLNQIGGGSGEKNYVTAPSTASGWTASGAGITVATATTGLPRTNTTKTGILVTGASGSSAYAYYRFTLDSADYSKKLKLQFDLAPVSGYADSDFKVDVYSNTASNYGGTSTRLALSTDSSAVSAVPNLTGTYRTTFDATTSTAPYLEFRIGLNGTNTHALTISDVIIGPGVVVQGAAVSEWQSYTATITASGGGSVAIGSGGGATASSRWRRVGDSMEVQFYWQFGTSGTSFGTSGFYSFGLPTGYTVDTAKITGTSGNAGQVGAGQFLDSSASDYYGLAMMATSTGTIIADIEESVSGANLGTTGPVTLAVSDNITAVFRVPIAEWSGSGVVNVAQNDVEYAYNTAGTTAAGASDTTSFGYGPSGAAFGSIASTTAASSVTTMYVRFKTPMQTTDMIILEYDVSSGNNWVAVGAGNYVSQTVQQNASVYGAGVSFVNSTDVAVAFGNKGYKATGVAYGDNGAAWSGISTWKWRVKKVAAGQAVGFGGVTQNNSGLVKSAGQLLGTNTTDSAATGYVGEYLENVRSSASPNITTNTYCSIDSGNATFNDGAETGITLSAGDWDISAQAVFTGAGGDLPTQVELFVGTAAGASSTGQDIARAYQAVNVAVAAGGFYAETLNPYRVSLSANTTYYLKCRVVHTVGTVSARGCIHARRVR